jgi:dsRNA-specific ribonuclease
MQRKRRMLTFVAVDFVQEKVLGQGQQSNETAAEQAKDEAISDFIRDQYKKTTGSDVPIEDKDKKYGV